MSRKEIGSYFIIEPPAQNENFSLTKFLDKFGKYHLFLDSGRSALRYVAKISKRKVVLLPNYLCDSMIQPFIEENYQLRFYNISKKLEPVIETIVLDDNIGIFIHMGYFGFNTNDTIKNLIEELNRKNILIVEDITHTIFSNYPRILHSDFYICSYCKIPTQL